MKNVTLFLHLLLTLAAVSLSAGAQVATNHNFGSRLRPDLYIRQIKGMPGSETLLKVQIANKGSAASLPCTLTIGIYRSNAFNENAMREYVDMDVPGIEPEGATWVATERVGTDFIKSDRRGRVRPLLPFILTIDWKNVNAGSNENNNVVRYRVRGRALRKL